MFHYGCCSRYYSQQYLEKYLEETSFSSDTCRQAAPCVVVLTSLDLLPANDPSEPHGFLGTRFRLADLYPPLRQHRFLQYLHPHPRSPHGIRSSRTYPFPSRFVPYPVCIGFLGSIICNHVGQVPEAMGFVEGEPRRSVCSSASTWDIFIVCIKPASIEFKA